MGFWYRTLTSLRLKLTTYLQKESIMSFEPSSSVVFAALPAVAASLMAFLDSLPIPEGQDWSVTRLTKDAFFGELGLPGAPLVVLSPPEDSI